MNSLSAGPIERISREREQQLLFGKRGNNVFLKYNNNGIICKRGGDGGSAGGGGERGGSAPTCNFSISY